MTNTQTPPHATTVVIPTGAPATNTVANHAERPEKFNGQNFKRWQQKMFFYLTTLGLARFLKETVPQVEPPAETALNVVPWETDGESVLREAIIMSQEFRYDHNGKKVYKSDWKLDFDLDDDSSVELLSFDVDFDSYPNLMNLFIEAIANDREFGFAWIQLLHEIGYQEFGTRHFLKTRFTQFGESLIGLQVSRRLFHSSVMTVINNQGLSSEWKGSAGMFAYAICKAARFFCLHKVLRIVFCLNTSITLANSYEWMANIPKLWWKFSKWHREILDETPAKEDMTNKAAREFDKAKYFNLTQIGVLTG
ncbi:hypothetical protein Tco_1276553, partial [Tanacetum coccineum]